MVNVINDDLTVISAHRFVSIKAIDGGDTVVVTLDSASSEVVSLLIPREAAQKMACAIGEYVENSPGQAARYPEI